MVCVITLHAGPSAESETVGCQVQDRESPIVHWQKGKEIQTHMRRSKVVDMAAIYTYLFTM